MSDWYYAVNNEQKGPVTEADLKEQLAAGRIPADSLVWRDGMANWTPANQVAALSSREPATTVTLSPEPSTVVHTPGAHNPESATPLTLSSLFGPGEALEVEPEDAENNKIYGILAYLFILWLVPLLAAKDSPFSKYHANQGLVLFIIEIALFVVLQVLYTVLGFIPGASRLDVVFSLAWLGIILLLIIGVINAAAGKCVPLPVIGKFKLIK